MSVYTAVPEASLREWLARYRIGPLEGFVGIAAGVENTNFFVDTASGRYVLTLFERLPDADVGQYLALMAHLAAARVSCPRPLADGDGRLFSPLCGKAAALVSRIPGASVDAPEAAHCAAIGRWLADMHLAAADFAPRWENPRGVAWRERVAAELAPLLTTAQQQLLAAALQAQHRLTNCALPRGLVHADLFRDNALFSYPERALLGGVIDFYFAGEDALLFDLAVVANDWCRAKATQLDAGRSAALLDAYAARRPLSAAERAAWPAMLQVAALRFWLSRLHDALNPRAGTLVLTKDPGEYENLLAAHLATA